MSTPSGNVKPSHVQLLNRYKLSARETQNMYKILKAQNKTQYLSDLQSQLLEKYHKGCEVK